MTPQTWLSKGTPSGLLLLSLLVGIGGAVGAAVFHFLIFASTVIFFGFTGSGSFINTVENLPLWQRLLAPTAGGLLVGIIFYLAKVSEAEGEGVPEVMDALAVKRGRIRPIVAPIKIITAALTLGSGGSAGREGPIIQIGSTIGSSIAQYTKQATQERMLLLACGAAAGIGGTFGAPIAGVFFTIEILRHKTKNFYRLSLIALSATVSSVISLFVIGHEVTWKVTDATVIISLQTLVTMIGIGVCAAFIALLFGSILSWGKAVFKKITLHPIFKPALGGLGIGCMGLLLPHLHEPAANPLIVDLVTMSSIPVTFLVILLVLKMIATSITLGSGGSGGIFAPLLLLGAILGSITVSLLLSFNLIPVAFAPYLILLGMAGVFAGAAHAPLTAAFIIFEMSDSFTLLLPLLLVTYTANLITKKLKPESIYETAQ